jgi:type II secretory pathway predicted ATPase ExeA
VYREFFELREAPFELTSDPRYLFFTDGHREALSNLEYGLSARKALTVLIGEAGTGKTTLLHAAFASACCRHITCIYLNNPALTRDEFVFMVAGRFNLGPEAARSKAIFLDTLEAELRARYARGEGAALVVDEAQRLSTELLEEIRLLGNIETPSTKLLPLVLAGQSELRDRLEEPALRQLKQRVALRCEIRPLQAAETAAYIAARVQIAGGIPTQLFSREAVELIHVRSGGIPRSISVICDNALVSAMALARRPVDCAIVMDVCRDFCFDARPIHVPLATEPAAVAASPVLSSPLESPDRPDSPLLFKWVSRPRC